MGSRNVIIVNDFAYVQGGADNVAILSAIGLAKSENYHVHFFSGVGPVSKMLIEAGVEVHCVEKIDILRDNNRMNAIINGLYDRHVERAFRDLLMRYNGLNTIVHIHTWTKALTSAVFRVASEMQFRVVLTLHDYFSVCPNGGLYNYRKKQICTYKPLSLKCLISNCDLRSPVQKQWRVIRQIIQNSNIRKLDIIYLLAISKKVEDEVKGFFPNSNLKLFYLHNPIEILNHNLVDIRSNSKFLFMGRLAKEKGPELFCRAITDLGLEGIVIGDGYLKDSLRKEYPNITFTGWLSGEEKYSIVRDCKCFVMASRWYETFGLVVAEMKALGIPSIVPEESAAAEQIESGWNGFYFKSGSLDSLKEAILKFEKCDIVSMHKNVVSSFHSEQYSIDAHVKKLSEIYNIVLCS